MTEHPITPPPELIRQLLDDDDFPFRTGTHDLLSITKDRLNHVITQAARWGADQELEACCEWADVTGWVGAGSVLRRFRRPKPPSEAEQALGELEKIVVLLMPVTGPAKVERLGIIRAALKRLQQLEQLND